jgi:hypothetical protein
MTRYNIAEIIEVSGYLRDTILRLDNKPEDGTEKISHDVVSFLQYYAAS